MVESVKLINQKTYLTTSNNKKTRKSKNRRFDKISKSVVYLCKLKNFENSVHYSRKWFFVSSYSSSFIKVNDSVVISKRCLKLGVSWL